MGLAQAKLRLHGADRELHGNQNLSKKKEIVGESKNQRVIEDYSSCTGNSMERIAVVGG